MIIIHSRILKYEKNIFTYFYRYRTLDMRIISLVILMGALLATPLSSADTIYTWTDENGVVHMTNIPPVESSGSLDIIELDPPPITEAPEIQYALPEEPAASEDETKIFIIDNHVVVPVLLSYKGRQVNANLLLDTGSTNITLHKNIAGKLLIKKPQKGAIRVAGGEVIDAEAVTLDSVTVGPNTQKNLVAGIIEHHGPDVPFDGLLGMNFLKSYQYTIDFKDKVLRWNN